MVRLQVGDIVTVTPGSYERAGSFSAHDRLGIRDDSPPLRITRVFAERVIVRGALIRGTDASIYVWRHHIETVNGVNPTTGVAPRPLGTKPADTDEMTYIGLDHPGIQWLFQDMGAYADNKGWCSTYDDLARDLGIPAREEEHDVEVSHNGITISATIRATSLEQAEERLRAMLV